MVWPLHVGSNILFSSISTLFGMMISTEFCFFGGGGKKFSANLTWQWNKTTRSMQLCGRIIELNGCFIDSEPYALQNPVRKWLSSGQEGCVRSHRYPICTTNQHFVGVSHPLVFLFEEQKRHPVMKQQNLLWKFTSLQYLYIYRTTHKLCFKHYNTWELWVPKMTDLTNESGEITTNLTYA